MYVCVCHAISDRDIKQLVAEGASTVGEIMECTGAGSKCGSCINEIACMVEEKRGPASLASRRVLKVVRSSNAA